MLAHFEHFDLPSLLEDLDLLHVGLLDCLDRGLCALSLVSGCFNQAELTLAENLSEFVIVEQI